MATKEIERKIAVIFATDVVGYSKSVEKNEDQTIKNFRACKKILEDLFKEHDGRIFNTAGDSVLAEFSSAVSAVICATEFQKLMKERNESETTDLKMEFRIGINMGDVVVEGDNLYGDGVNIAARLEALAQPNGVCLSRSVHEFINKKMDFLFNDLGEQTVKDNKFHAFDVVIDDSHKRTVKTKTKSKVPLIASIVGILVLSIGGYAYYNNTLIEQPEEEKKVARDNLPIILVKPFRNLQAPNDSELSISDAITETLITGLQQYSEIVTLSSSTSYHVATSGLSNAQIRQTYGVDYLVTGSVQKSNTKIRVTSELNNLTNNRVEWSKKFDFTNDDLFEIQDKINNKILSVLQIKTVVGEGAVVGDRTLHNEGSIESYTLMLNMRRYLRQLSPEGWHRADDIFKELIKSDLAEEGKMTMSVWHRVVKIFTGLSTNKEKDLKDIIEFSDKSLELSKNESTYTTRAFVEANLLKNCEKALAYANLANPMVTSGQNLQILGLTFTGCNELSKGVANLEKALLQTPNDTDLRITKNLMSSYLISNKLKETIVLGENNLNKNDPVTYILLAYAEAKQGNVRKATGYIDDQKKFTKPMSKEIFDRQFSSLPNRDFVKNLFSELKNLGLAD